MATPQAARFSSASRNGPGNHFLWLTLEELQWLALPRRPSGPSWGECSVVYWPLWAFLPPFVSVDLALSTPVHGSEELAQLTNSVPPLYLLCSLRQVTYPF